MAILLSTKNKLLARMAGTKSPAVTKTPLESRADECEGYESLQHRYHAWPIVVAQEGNCDRQQNAKQQQFFFHAHRPSPLTSVYRHQ
jgi:hypothetical protein